MDRPSPLTDEDRARAAREAARQVQATLDRDRRNRRRPRSGRAER